jgi:hypothetical protein
MCFSIVRVGDYALPGDLRTGSGVYPRGTAIGLRDALRFFLPSPGFSQTKAKNDSQKNYGEGCSQIVSHRPMTLANPWRGVCTEATYLAAESFGESTGFLAVAAWLTQQSRQSCHNQRLCLFPMRCRLGNKAFLGRRTRVQAKRPEFDAGSIRLRPVARYAPSVAVPQPSISKAHGRDANKRVPQRGLSKKFRVSVEKSPCSRRGIGAMASTIQTCGIKGGTHGDWRVSRCDRVSRRDFVGRVGAVNAGRLVLVAQIPKWLY